MFKKTDTMLIENTKAEYCDVDKAYRITPDDGYVLHTKFYDVPVIDEETMEETGEIIKGYTDSYIVISSDYNFEANPYDIYAVATPTTEGFGDSITALTYERPKK